MLKNMLRRINCVISFYKYITHNCSSKILKHSTQTKKEKKRKKKRESKLAEIKCRGGPTQSIISPTKQDRLYHALVSPPRGMPCPDPTSN